MGDRPPVSLSQALHCRAELWLNANGYEPEAIRPGTRRTFDMGHMVEALMFDGVQLDGESAQMGPWWEELGTIKDPQSGYEINIADWEVTDRQLEVSLHGFKGHIDGLLRRRHRPGNGHGNVESILLPDCKTASGFSYDRAAKEDLASGVFSREYVGQLHAYRKGLIAQGITPEAMILLYYNKEQSNVMFRLVPHDQAIDDEIEERLAWARSEVSPTPEHLWQTGSKIPLRCGYCPQKANCATLRGVDLAMGMERGKPTWYPKAKEVA